MTDEVKKRRKGFTRVSRKNQVTLPVDVLQSAGIHTGQDLRVQADGPGRIVLIRVRDPVEEFAGSLTGVYQEGFLDELRGEWG